MGLRDLLVQRWQHQDSRVRLAALSELTGKNAEAILTHLAVHDPEKTIRKAAADRLTGGQIAALLKETNLEAVRLELVSNQLNAPEDQPVLLEVALSDPSGYVRDAAMRKLRDDSLLVRAALSDRASEIGLVAVSHLSDLFQTIYVLHNSNNPGVRAEAVRRLDRNLHLNEIIAVATTDDDDWVRESALAHLVWSDCPDLFSSLLKATSPPRLRMTATRRIPLPDRIDILRKLAADDPEPSVRKIAVTRLPTQTDLSLLLRIAAEDPDESVRRSAVDEISPDWTFSVLRDLAENDPAAQVRIAAQKKCATKHAAPAELPFRSAELSLVEWQALLEDAAQRGTEPAVREAAVSMLDPFVHAKTLRRIARRDKNPLVRALAVGRLHPPSCKKLLTTISEKDKDARVRRAAAYRLSLVK